MVSPRDIEELFQQNQEREQALKTLLKSRPSESRDVQALRGEIKAAYSEILGMDPFFCASKDVELLLWKNCYYKRIEDFRKRLRKYAHLAASLERSKAFEAQEHLHGICQAFARFLGEATDFYASLLRRFEAMHHQYAKSGPGGGGSDSGRSNSSGSAGGAGSGGEQRRSGLMKLVVLSINRCLIFLGDLARYRELHGENSVKDWSSAERFYHQALAVLPTSGNPHNQLAVVATYTDAECVSVYRYCRSLMIESPFQTAHENLMLLFEKNKQKGFGLSLAAGGTEVKGGSTGGGSSRDLGASGSGMQPTQHHGKGKGKGSGGRGNTGALLKSFLRRFVRLHGMIFSGRADDLEDFPSIFETAIADFRTLLSNSAFGDALLLKMVVICIFSVTHVAALRDPAGSSAPDYNMALLNDDSFSIAGSVLDATNNLDGGGNNSEHSPAGTGGGSGGSSVASTSRKETEVSKADDVRRKARLSYPLALAFGVSAQIGRHVRTQEPTHPSQGSQHHGGGGHGHGRTHHRHGSHGSSHGGGPGGDSSLLHGGGSGHIHLHGNPPPTPVMVYGGDTKSRPSTNQPQPRPLGSRLLGPVVLFCDWLTAQPRFLRLAEEEKSSSSSATAGGRGNGGGGAGAGGSNSNSSSSRGGGTTIVRVARAGGAVASVAVQEAEMRAQFWEVVQRLSATLPDQDPNNQPDAFPVDPLRRRLPLKEHVELRGFLPLAELYKQWYAMDGPAVPAVPDDCAGSVRIRGLKAFAAAVSGEPFVPAHPALHYQGDTMMATQGRERSEYQWSEASGGSGSYMTSQSHESGRHHLDTALRPRQPRSQFSRVPPGMGSDRGGGGSVGGGVERSRSVSGPLGYFNSGSSLGPGSEGGGRRTSAPRVPGPAGTGPPQHTRNASGGSSMHGGSVAMPQHHMPPSNLTRHYSQSIVPPSSGGGASDIDPSASYPHPPLHRVQSQVTAVTALASNSSSSRMFSSRQSDGAGALSMSGNRHSLDSGMRHYESGSGGGGSSRHPPSGKGSGGGGGGCNNQSMASNSGSGSGSSGVSTHDTRSVGAWSAPHGRSGGGVGSAGGGGGGWAAEHETPRSSFRGEGSGDEEDMVFITPAFGAPLRRRSTGGGGGPVVGSGGGDGRDSFARGGSDLGLGSGGGGGGGGSGGAGGAGGQGSDLGSAGSPQFGSGRTSGGLIGGMWGPGAFPAQELALSPQAPSDHAEDGERFAAEHSLFGNSSWRGALGSSGGASNNTPIGTPVNTPLDHGHSPPTSSPPGLVGNGGDRRLSAPGYGGHDSGSVLSDRGAPTQRHQHEEDDRNRARSFDHRASTDGGSGGVGYLSHPFLPGRQSSQQQQHTFPQERQEVMQTHGNVGQQVAYGGGQSVLSHGAGHRRQESAGSMHSARSSPPGFSDVIIGSPKNGGGNGGDGGSQQWGADRIFRDDVSSAVSDTRDQQHHRRFSSPTPQMSSTGAPPPYQQQQQQKQQQQQQTQNHLSPQGAHQHKHQLVYHRRASSPGTAGTTGRGAPGDDFTSGNSSVGGGRPHPQGQGRPASTLPAGSYAAGGTAGAVGGGSSSLGNPVGGGHVEEGASSIFSSNRSGHSSYSGLSGFSYTPFGSNDVGSIGGGAGGGSKMGASTAVQWNTRTPSSTLPKGDSGPPLVNGLSGEDGIRNGGGGGGAGGGLGSYAAAHGSPGGALGWGAVMGTSSSGAQQGSGGGGQG